MVKVKDETFHHRSSLHHTNPLIQQSFNYISRGESEASCIFDVSPYYVPEKIEERGCGER